MEIPVSPHAGQCITLDGVEWVWIPHDVERAHWLAMDGTAATVFPASDGIPDVMACIPNGTGRETVAHFAPDNLVGAFRFATSHHRRSVN